LLETFVQLHGYELVVTDGELLEVILGLAAGEIAQDAFVSWVHERARLFTSRRRKKLHAVAATKENV